MLPDWEFRSYALATAFVFVLGGLMFFTAYIFNTAFP